MSKRKAGLSPSLSRHQRVSKPATRSHGGIVVSQNRLASEIGARVLAQGGHAIDAAVAVSFAIGVLEPWMSGLGGSGAMLVRDAASGKVTVIDFGARSPLALDPADYPLAGGETGGDLFGWPKVKDDRNLVGATAACAPTTLAGAHMAHRLFGRMRWSDLVAPAIPLAADGPAVDWHTLVEIASTYTHLSRDPGCRAAFLPGNAPPVPPPAVTPQPVVRLPNLALAKTIGTIAADGPDALYRGPIGRALAEDFRAAGGCVTEKDLAAVEARMLTPRTVEHNDHTISVQPELGGGPTMIRAFEALARRWKPTGEGALDADAFTAVAASLKDAWEDRFDNMGDTPTTAATSTTTHFSVVDRDGNMVAWTQTLLSIFGSRFLSPSTGILMNNAINWFDPRPGGPNSIAPGKRALCNYTPAIMAGANQSVAIGGSGGRKIMPAVFQLLAMLANGMSLDEAFHAPRIDVSGGERVVVDRDLPEAVRSVLAAKFETVEVERTAYPAHFTIAGAVRRSGSVNEGATEPHMPWSEAVSEEEV